VSIRNETNFSTNSVQPQFSSDSKFNLSTYTKLLTEVYHGIQALPNVQDADGADCGDVDMYVLY